MARIIAVVNQKGGVGKTTTTVNLTATLCAQGKRVLLCDFDPQANATSGLGVDKNGASPNIYDVLINGADVERAVVSTKYGDVLPSNKALAGASTDGRVSDGVKVAGYTDIRGDILELSVVVMQGENVKLDVVSNAKGTYNNDFETNNTAFGAETGIVTYTIDTSGISFAK